MTEEAKTPVKRATTTKYATPHVHEAMANILKSLSVEKGGVLPGNMGGKPYITAVDAAAEVKRKFVENDLIFLPKESIFQHKEIINKDRINVLISITGEYTFVSTQDGSSVVVSGTGDGLAGGTAVASNIASTNALKNALLRTFLITEQSVEDAAKNGPAEETQSAPARRIEQAKAPVANKPTGTPAARDILLSDWIEAGKISKDEVNERYNAFKAKGLPPAEAWVSVLKDLEAGK